MTVPLVQRLIAVIRGDDGDREIEIRSGDVLTLDVRFVDPYYRCIMGVGDLLVMQVTAVRGTDDGSVHLGVVRKETK